MLEKVVMFGLESGQAADGRTRRREAAWQSWDADDREWSVTVRMVSPGSSWVSDSEPNANQADLELRV
eukprot:1007212-Rhodomonas_salina.1